MAGVAGAGAMSGERMNNHTANAPAEPQHASSSDATVYTLGVFADVKSAADAVYEAAKMTP
jgi:hypothetical protein